MLTQMLALGRVFPTRNVEQFHLNAITPLYSASEKSLIGAQHNFGV